MHIELFFLKIVKKAGLNTLYGFGRRKIDPSSISSSLEKNNGPFNDIWIEKKSLPKSGVIFLSKEVNQNKKKQILTR